MEIMGKWEQGSGREQHFFEHAFLYSSDSWNHDDASCPAENK